MTRDRRAKPFISDQLRGGGGSELPHLITFLMTNSTMPSLSPARRNANVQRRRSLNAEIRRLKNYYSGTFKGEFGRTASARHMNKIMNMMRELAARRIQATVRRRQATARVARAHTRARAPRNNVAAAAFSPRRVGHVVRTYGMNAMN